MLHHHRIQILKKNNRERDPHCWSSKSHKTPIYIKLYFLQQSHGKIIGLHLWLKLTTSLNMFTLRMSHCSVLITSLFALRYKEKECGTQLGNGITDPNLEQTQTKVLISSFNYLNILLGQGNIGIIHSKPSKETKNPLSLHQGKV